MYGLFNIRYWALDFAYTLYIEYFFLSDKGCVFGELCIMAHLQLSLSSGGQKGFLGNVDKKHCLTPYSRGTQSLNSSETHLKNCRGAMLMALLNMAG